MFCRDCGEKLTLRFLENEGIVPYCPRCDKFKFPFFPVAVLMIVLNRQNDRVLLAKHAGEEEYKLLAGYLKKGENAEKAIPRELKEETGLKALKWKYLGSRYQDEKEVLMLAFAVTSDDTLPIFKNEELDEVRWCNKEEAKALIKKSSLAEHFLNLVLSELPDSI